MLLICAEIVTKTRSRVLDARLRKRRWCYHHVAFIYLLGGFPLIRSLRGRARQWAVAVMAEQARCQRP